MRDKYGRPLSAAAEQSWRDRVAATALEVALAGAVHAECEVVEVRRLAPDEAADEVVGWIAPPGRSGR